MAGVGTVPLEAASRWGDVLSLGGDNELEVVEQMAANARRFELAPTLTPSLAPVLPLTLT